MDRDKEGWRAAPGWFEKEGKAQYLPLSALQAVERGLNGYITAVSAINVQSETDLCRY